MGILSNLKQLYFAATAFVVFVILFISAQAFLDGAVRLVTFSLVPFEQRREPVNSATMREAPPPATTPEPIPAPPKPLPIQEDWELRSAKEQVASALATLLVALPIWWLHWRRFGQLSHEKTDYLFYKIYNYLLMVISLIAIVIRGGSAIGQVVRVLLGLITLTQVREQLQFANDLAGAALGTLLAIGVWYYHWRTVESLPETPIATAGRDQASTTALFLLLFGFVALLLLAAIALFGVRLID